MKYWTWYWPRIRFHFFQRARVGYAFPLHCLASGIMEISSWERAQLVVCTKKQDNGNRGMASEKCSRKWEMWHVVSSREAKLCVLHLLKSILLLIDPVATTSLLLATWLFYQHSYNRVFMLKECEPFRTTDLDSRPRVIYK